MPTIVLTMRVVQKQRALPNVVLTEIGQFLDPERICHQTRPWVGVGGSKGDESALNDCDNMQRATNTVVVESMAV